MIRKNPLATMVTLACLGGAACSSDAPTATPPSVAATAAASTPPAPTRPATPIPTPPPADAATTVPDTVVTPVPKAVKATCPNANGDGLTCWQVAVPADYAKPDGPTIDLAVTIHKADPTKWASPVLTLGGFVTFADWSAVDPIVVLKGHDAIVVDSRGAGTGRSAPLPLTCTDNDTLYAAQLNTLSPGPELRALLKKCIEDADKGTSSLASAIDHDVSAADLAMVRKALGIDTWAITSRALGLDTAVRLLDIDSAAVTSLVALVPQIAGTGPTPESANAAFAAFAADCAATPACAANGDMNAIAGQLKDRPSTVKDPQSGENITIPKAAGLSGIIVGISDPALVSIVPGLLGSGGTAAGADALASVYASRPPYIDPIYLASLCQDVAYVQPARDTWGSSDRGVFGARTWAALCDAAGPVPQVHVPHPISGDIPVFAIVVDYDHRNSVAAARSIFTGMPNTTIVTVPGIASVRVQLADCYVNTLTAFFDGPSKPVDASCLTSPAAKSLG